MRALICVAAISLTGVAACDAVVPETPLSEGGAVEVAVAPLNLPGLTNASYTVTVLNDAEQLVWTADLTSDQYGNGEGDISYVGPCDAEDSDAADGGVALNVVQVVVADLYRDDPSNPGTNTPLGASEWINPCTVAAPCAVAVECRENEDAYVELNLTVMRSAHQGFFDVAVNFEDIFCSAKLDCREDSDDSGEVTPSDDYRQLLFNAGGSRDDTVVMALACTAGPGQDTRLYMSDIVVSCDEGDFLVVPSKGPGNLGNTPGGILPGAPNAALFQAAVYQGVETLTTSGTDLAKRYWNVALGLAGGTDCSVSAVATAANGAFVDATTPASTTYPYIAWAVDLDTCTQHPLGSAEVAIGYTGLSTPLAFDNAFDGTTASVVTPPLPLAGPLVVNSATSLPRYTSIDGDVTITGPGVGHVDLSSVTSISGTLRIENLDPGDSVSLTKLASVTGKLQIYGNDGFDASFPSLTAAGEFWVENNGATTSFSFPALVSTKWLIFKYNDSPGALDLPSLTTLTSGGSNISYNAISALTAPVLTSIPGLTMSNMPNVALMDFSSVTTVADVQLYGNNIVELRLPSLQTAAVGNQLRLENLGPFDFALPNLTSAGQLVLKGALTSAALPELLEVRRLSLEYAPNLVSVSAPKLATATQSFTASAGIGALSTIDLGAFEDTPSFTFSNTLVRQCEIDVITARVLANDPGASISSTNNSAAACD